ncbi:MAG TPA: glutathione S-transferase family protein [Solirubrobacteraceae bacterium]
MRLHDYAASGNCLKVRLLLALLGREYERVPVDIFAGETLTAEFAALNPARTTPVLELDDGTTLAESAAILWYLAEETPYLPDDRLQRARVLQWLCSERALTAAVAGARFQMMTGRTDGETPFLLVAGRGKLATLDRRLTGREWVATDAPTIADIALFAYTHVAEDAGRDLSADAGIGAWLDRIRALPGYGNDLIPYPANARPGASRSIYD